MSSYPRFFLEILNCSFYPMIKKNMHIHALCTKKKSINHNINFTVQKNCFLIRKKNSQFFERSNHSVNYLRISNCVENSKYNNILIYKIFKILITV